MIDKPHQIHLMLGAARDYQEGLVSLHMLIDKISGLENIIEDDALSDLLYEPLWDLEQVNARIITTAREIDEREKSIVDRTVAEIIAKVESYSSHSE